MTLCVPSFNAQPFVKDSGELVRTLSDGSIEISVLVSAGSSRAGIRGIHGKAVKLAVHAPPERGKATAEALEVIAKWLGVPIRQVSLVSGPASRNKVMRISGVSPARVRDLRAGIGCP